MDFTYDDEQVALREAVRGLVGKAYSDYENRRAVTGTDLGYDERLWGQLAEMGLLGLPFSEEDGGVGAGPVEVAIVCQELGRVIAPEPYLGAVVLAGGLVAAAGSAEQRAELLGGLASGETLLAFAHVDAATPVTATADGALHGVKEAVLHGARADVLIVSAALPEGGTGLFVVDGAAAERTAYPTYDGGRAARVSFDGVTATPLGAGGDASAAISQVLDLAVVMAANEALAMMQAQLQLTTEYLKSRKQFGVTLNTFQALNFRAADMYTSLELTHSLTDWATMVAATGDVAALHDAAARVGLQVSRAGRHIGQEAIQLHGGIGVTAEYSVGMYTAHATALEHLFGDDRAHLATLGARLFDYSSIDPLAVRS